VDATILGIDVDLGDVIVRERFDDGWPQISGHHVGVEFLLSC